MLIGLPTGTWLEHGVPRAVSWTNSHRRRERHLTHSVTQVERGKPVLLPKG
jgi:hypothetical protein